MTDKLTKCKEFLRNPTYIPPEELAEWADEIYRLESLIFEARALVGAKNGDLLSKIIALKWSAEEANNLFQDKKLVEKLKSG